MPGEISVLFWNVRQKNLAVSIGRIAKAHSVDLIVLAELAGAPDAMRRDISQEVGRPFYYSNRHGAPSKTHVFMAGRSDYISQCYSRDLGRLSMFLVDYPLFPGFVLGTIHGESKANASAETLAEEAKQMMSEARRECLRVGRQQLLLVGDFNMNPFDKGMMYAGYFHAVMDKRVASRGSRKIQSEEYPMMYSPMWSFLGDYPSGPSGTFYHSPAEHETAHWHVIDQFLMSPALLKLAEITELEIVSNDGVESFLRKSGLIRGDEFSDHLPIRVKLQSNR